VSLVYKLDNVSKSRLVNGTGFRMIASDIQIERGEHIALVGSSGCGKSTLLDIFALVSRPTDSDVFTFKPDDNELSDVKKIWQKRKQNQLSSLRSKHIGYVLQQGGLLPYLTVRENIELSRNLLNMEADDTVNSLCRVLGIDRHLEKLPGLLSTGERQRVAFARALAHRPSIIIADEPTASLDPITSRKIMAVVMELIKGLGITMLIASHDWAQIYKLDMHSLSQNTRTLKNGVIESVFSKT